MIPEYIHTYEWPKDQSSYGLMNQNLFIQVFKPTKILFQSILDLKLFKNKTKINRISI
jgi:hypothetical protein